jgi:hypothetical protein
MLRLDKYGFTVLVQEWHYGKISMGKSKIDSLAYLSDIVVGINF